MSGQHRATPSDWFQVEQVARIGSSDCNCLLELRARVEALEADQLEQAESGRFCVDAIVRRVEALELAKPAAVTRLHSYKVGEAEPIEDWGKGHTLVNPTPAPEARPAVGGLVERVANAIYPSACADPEARAAIREVAAAAKDLRFTTAKALIDWLEREAGR